jgi:hypothetical protein
MKNSPEPEPDFAEWVAELNREAARRGCPEWKPAGETQESRDYWYGFFRNGLMTPAQALDVDQDDREETLTCLDCGAVNLWKAWNDNADHCPACGSGNADIDDAE